MPDKPFIRSTTLIHWTEPKAIRSARDKETGAFPANFAPPSDSPQLYLDHLKLIYSTGLLFSEKKEPPIFGAFNAEAHLPPTEMICFSELHTHMVSSHADLYGKMGVGFSRQKLFYYGANPVFYVPNMGVGIPSTNLRAIVEMMMTPNSPLIKFLAFVKPMSRYTKYSEDKDADLHFYDEMEWRMIPLGTLTDPNGKMYTEFDWIDGDYFRFKYSDVIHLILPDQETLRLVEDDADMQKWFTQSKPATIETLADALNKNSIRKE